MTFRLAVASGITNAQGASFVLGSALKRPFTCKRPAHEERGIIPLAAHHRTAMRDVCFAVTTQLLPQRHESVQRRFLGYDRRSAGLGPRCKGGDCARL
jgi:hypothetical protein